MPSGTPLGEMYIELGLDTSHFSTGLQSAKRGVQYFQSEIRGLDTVLKSNGKNTQALQAKYRSLGQAIQAQKAVLAELKTNFDKLEPGTAKWEKAAVEIERENAKLAAMEQQLHEVGTALENVQSETRGFENDLRGLDIALKINGKNTQALQAKFHSLGKAIQEQKALLVELKMNFDKLEPGTAKWEEAAAEIEREHAKLEAMKQELHEVKNALQKVHAENSKWGKVSTGLTEWGNKLQEVGGRLQSFGNKTAEIGAAFTKGVTAPIIAGAGYAVKAAIDFESAFAGVKKTVDETATVSYKNLSDGIRQMAKELPASAVEIANVAEAAGQLGIRTEDVLSFSRTMIDMGESTNLSATDAATAIAKIANITGLTADEYSRFGSSVVALGNNFATTESDIVQMSNRLASAGTLAGLTNQEILGLATAMSSVGIEAEAGGTAMTQTLSAIEEAVVEAGDDLAMFAQIAGMSADQFAATWNEKPIEAIQAFIKGVGELDEKGQSATIILDELGLSGVRQSNMIKSLALASDTLTGAVELSTRAWEENTALTDEASKRYETTESKLKMLKNEVVDVAIEFGGPLVDALRDGLEASKPFIETLSNMAKQFSSLDKEQQQQIIKWGLIAAAAGPALSIFGKGVSTIGSVVSGVGTFSKALGTLTGKLATTSAVAKVAGGASGLAGIGTAATGAASGASLLTGAVGLLANPVTWGVILGGVAVGALAYFGKEAIEASRRTREWGAAVNETQAKELQGFKDKVDETNKAFADFGVGGVAQVESVTNAVRGLADEINRLTDKKLDEHLKLAEKFGLSDKEVQQIRDNAESSKRAVETMSNEVLQIYKNANEHRRKLSDEEKEIVMSTQKALVDKQLELMEFSGKERTAIQKAINGEFHELNQDQLTKALNVTKKWLEEENKAHKKSKQELKQLLKDGAIDQAVYHREMEELEAEHLAKLEAYGDRYMAIRQEMAKNVKSFGDTRLENSYWSTIEKEMEKLGLSYEELQKRMQGFADTAQQSSTLVASSIKDMSADMSAANLAWNSIVLEPKTGEIKTNAQEEIQKALQAEGGWDNMKFILKEANLQTNAKIMVGEVLQAIGQWEHLTPEEKYLVTDGSPAIEAIFTSKQMLESWNSLPEDVKKLLGDNQDFLSSAASAESALTRWNLMTPTEKSLKADAIVAIMNSNNATQALSEFNGTPTLDKVLAVDGINAVNNTTQATETVNQYNQTLTPEKQLLVNPFNAISNTTQATSTVNEYNNTPTPVKELTSNPASLLNGTNQSISLLGNFNGVSLPTKQLNAQDNTAGPVSDAKRNINSVQDRTVTITGIFRRIGEFFNFEKGTNFHTGGLAMVNDQKGPLYRELITLPTGESFIPHGRDVLIDLPRGSKVLPAAATKRLMESKGIPKYAQGVGIPSESRFIKEMSTVQDKTVVVSSRDNGQSSAVLVLLKEILTTLKERDHQAFTEVMMNVKLGNRTFSEIVEMITVEQNKRDRIRRKTSSI